MAKLIQAAVGYGFLSLVLWVLHLDDRRHRQQRARAEAEQYQNRPHPDF